MEEARLNKINTYQRWINAHPGHVLVPLVFSAFGKATDATKQHLQRLIRSKGELNRLLLEVGQDILLTSGAAFARWYGLERREENVPNLA